LKIHSDPKIDHHHREGRIGARVLETDRVAQQAAVGDDVARFGEFVVFGYYT
jgi:hypothetical protein